MAAASRHSSSLTVFTILAPVSHFVLCIHMHCTAVPLLLLQVLEAHDRPLTFRLHQLGASECHFAYRMLVVMMRRDLSMAQVSSSSSNDVHLLAGVLVVDIAAAVWRRLN
jgi:hypothetical protein